MKYEGGWKALVVDVPEPDMYCPDVYMDKKRPQALNFWSTSCREKQKRMGMEHVGACFGLNCEHGRPYSPAVLTQPNVCGCGRPGTHIDDGPALCDSCRRKVERGTEGRKRSRKNKSVQLRDKKGR